MPFRRIPLSATLNTRDLGGYPAAGGKVTQFGRAIRSDIPSTLSAEDTSLLQRIGVTDAIDLRSDEETILQPSAFEGSTDFHYHRCPFAIGNQDPGSPAGVAPLYMRIVNDFSMMQRIMQLIARARGGVLIHCAAGKDRTGVVAALLLLTADVDRRDILADYQLSATYRQPVLRRLFKQQPGLPAYIGRTDIDYMDDMLNRFFQNYGSIDNYLATISVRKQESRKLKAKLIEPTEQADRASR